MTIKGGFDVINKLNLNEYPINIKEYIGKRLTKNEVSTIINNCSSLNLRLTPISLLFDSPEVVFLSKGVSFF